MNFNHTPIPWTSFTDKDIGVFIGYEPEKKIVAYLGDQKQSASNAEFIVYACNRHETYEEALIEILKNPANAVSIAKHALQPK